MLAHIKSVRHCVLIINVKFFQEKIPNPQISEKCECIEICGTYIGMIKQFYFVAQIHFKVIKSTSEDWCIFRFYVVISKVINRRQLFL